MTDYDMLIVSERSMFRRTFSKLLDVLDSNVHQREHDGNVDQLQSGNIPVAANGFVLIDCAALAIDDVISRILLVLSIQAESAITIVIDEQDDDIVDAAMSLGAVGAIVKASPPQVIIDSLQQILNGVRCRPAPMISIAREDIPESLRKQLSARQQKMLRAIMGGQAISATARELGITPDKLVMEMRQVVAIFRGRDF